MNDASPAMVYALVFGVVLVAAAILGFFYSSRSALCTASSRFGASSWETAPRSSGSFPVNTEDNVLHLVIGIAGLAAGGASPAPTAGVERTA